VFLKANRIRARAELRIVDWSEYAGLLKKLEENVRASHFDGIVGIGRGGSIMAAYLASKMGIPTFTPVFIRHVRSQSGDVKIEVHDLGQVKSLKGRLLVVDDSLIQGRAMNFVLNLIPKSARVKTLVMYVRSGAKFKPDFIGTEFDGTEQDLMFFYDLP